MKKKSTLYLYILAGMWVSLAAACGKEVQKNSPKEELDKMVHEEADPSSEKKG